MEPCQRPRRREPVAASAAPIQRCSGSFLSPHREDLQGKEARGQPARREKPATASEGSASRAPPTQAGQQGAADVLPSTTTTPPRLSSRGRNRLLTERYHPPYPLGRLTTALRRAPAHTAPLRWKGCIGESSDRCRQHAHHTSLQ